MRNTKQKQAIISYFEKFPEAHPCAEEVYEYVKQEIPTIGIATVYRNLNQFIEDNEIRCLLVNKNSTHYDYFAHDHAHFICENCGCIKNIPMDDFLVIQQKLEKETGCLITKKDIIFRGICEDCQNK